MENAKFIGVYTGSLDTIKTGNIETRREHWYMWFMQNEHRYIMKPLDPKSHHSACFITPMQFGLNFIEEKNIKIKEPACPDPATLEFYKRNKSPFALDDSSRSKSQNITFKTGTIDTEDKSVLELIKHKAVEQSSTPAPVEEEDINLAEIGLLLPSKELEEKFENIRVTKVEREIRIDLDNAMDMWMKGKKKTAMIKFEALLNRQEGLVEGHKHIFTDCAVSMRKINQNDKALAFAVRSAELSPEDSHAFFNVARMYFELRRYKEAHEFIVHCLELEPGLRPALKLKGVIEEILERLER